MPPAKRIDVTAKKFKGIYPRQHWARIVIVFSLLVLYIISFESLFHSIGPIGAALIAIPIALTGLYFGTPAGIAGGVIGVIVSSLLLAKFEGETPWVWLVKYWPGNLMALASGYIASRFHNEMMERALVDDTLSSHDRFLTMIGKATKSILEPVENEDAYSQMLTHLADLFAADFAHLIRWNEARKQAILVATTTPLHQPLSRIALNAEETSFLETVLQERRVVVVEDVSNSHYEVNPGSLKANLPETRSALSIPLLIRENKFGMIVFAFNAPRRFKAEELTYAELAGNQIALALWTFEQDIQIKKQLREANALAQIERALSETERVGMEAALQLIVNSAKELIPAAKNVILHLLDEEQQLLVPRAVAGLSRETHSKTNMRPGEGIAGQVISTGEIISISDIHNDSRLLKQNTDVKFRSLAVAPIQGNERRSGTISIHSDEVGAFTADDINLLGALGTQAAIAIENARLLETTRKDLKEINALYRVSRGMANSLEPDQLMRDVVQLLQKNFEYYHVEIFIKDPQTQNLVARHGVGNIGNLLAERGFYLPLGKGMVGHVAETGVALVSNDVDHVPYFRRNPLLPDTQSEMSVPIKIENQVVGVLDIQAVPPNIFTSRDEKLMTAVTEQLAVILQKANLYDELQKSLEKEKATRSQLMKSERLAVAGRLLASVSHELNNPLQAIQNALFLLKNEETLSAQGRQDLGIVLSETERMATMLSRLRSTYRPIQADDFQDIQLNGIVEDVYALTATLLRHKELAFEFIPDPDLPLTPCVPDQIRQVTLNLFMNAAEAMKPGGSITVRTNQIPEEGRVLLSVSDTGPGIKPEILPRIFEPFITGKESGTGLGLTITHDIVQRHHGIIQAENNPNGGATFYVWLPMKKQE